MKIEFQKVMPHPLLDFNHPEDSIWDKDFYFSSPEKIMLNAQSGKGKSTFVNIIFGVRKDYNGSILIDGQDIRSFNESQLVRMRTHHISVVFQDLQLFPNLTVAENLKIKNDLTHHRDEKTIMEYLDILRIADKYDKNCGHLSMGQQQRVCIIRALLQPFDMLLMDEPFSHLDEKNTQLSLDLINKETTKNNAGFVITTLGENHDFNFDRELKI